MVVLPDWLDVNSWNDWVEFRKEIKKKLTPTSIKKQLEFLEEHKLIHTEIIKQSIKHGWTGLYSLKGDNKKAELLDRCTKESSRSYIVADENTF